MSDYYNGSKLNWEEKVEIFNRVLMQIAKYYDDIDINKLSAYLQNDGKTIDTYFSFHPYEKNEYIKHIFDLTSPKFKINSTKGK